MPAPAVPRNLPIALLLLRLGVAVVMIFWTIDKMINPEHARSVFSNFYGMSDLGASTLLAIGMVQAVIVLAFAVGAFRTLSYGAVLLMHSISTLSSWQQYLEPFDLPGRCLPPARVCSCSGTMIGC